MTISGSKNAALPILAASILNKKQSKLYNVPNINDTEKTRELLKSLGCKVAKRGNKVTIDSRKMAKHEIPIKLMKEMRSSVVFAGSLIGRFKKAKFTYPGGCDIGVRPIDIHLDGFRKLNINVEETEDYIICNTDKIIGNTVDLKFPSVGATENIMMVAVLAEGETIINNAAMEPEIVDLQNFLNLMGAKITGSRNK